MVRVAKHKTLKKQSVRKLKLRERKLWREADDLVKKFRKTKKATEDEKKRYHKIKQEHLKTKGIRIEKEKNKLRGTDKKPKNYSVYKRIPKSLAPIKR